MCVCACVCLRAYVSEVCPLIFLLFAMNRNTATEVKDNHFGLLQNELYFKEMSCRKM